ncbi:MAG: hypothetical protein KIG81_10965, partial [Thermoguttaceae bacterium]|nr:hypothetical protein [Thermoguttaceae bacterium]
LFANNKYRFDINDFQEQFHRIVYGAVDYLAHSGMEKIDYIDIDKFLQPYESQYKVFCDNRGIEYIQKILEMYDPKKFDYYYNTLKKYSLLVLLNNQGINTSDLYDPSIVNPDEQQKMQERFDKMSVNDIITSEEVKVAEAKKLFGSSSDLVEGSAGDSLRELKEELKKAPVMGMPLMSPILTTLYRGQRFGCLNMTSAPSGVGKTRIAVGEACHLAIPEYYDCDKKQWISTGLEENVLIIETELELQEVQTMMMAHVSGIPESRILDGNYSKEEEQRLDKAIDLIEASKSRFFFVSITNFDSDDVINTIKSYYMTRHVNYVFFDYLSESIKMLAEGTRKTKVQGLRTDQILLQMSTALKDCAKQLNIYIWTATQLSGDYKNVKEADSTSLRGAKSLADKTDCAAILLPVRDMDNPIIETYCAKGFEVKPNFVLHVYKIRRGTYQNIRVYTYFDRGTCRMYDCFVTDSNGVMLPVEPTYVKIGEKAGDKKANDTLESVLDATSQEKLEDVYNNIDFEF